MRDLMIDIETLGTAHNAAIVQIGACYFDRYTGEVGKKFLMNIDLNSYEVLGKHFEVTGATLKWWFKQDKKTWLKEIDIETRDMTDVLFKLNEFAKEAKVIWSHATFDMPIITHAMKHFGIKTNWHYTDLRDIRTLSDLANIKVTTKNPKTHDALEDCLHQVEYCYQYINHLKK